MGNGHVLLLRLSAGRDQRDRHQRDAESQQLDPSQPSRNTSQAQNTVTAVNNDARTAATDVDPTRVAVRNSALPAVISAAMAIT